MELPPGAAFSYHRAVAPMLWILVGLMVVETAVVHLLVALWSGRAALILSLFSLAALVWLILLIRSFKRRPVLLDSASLTWRIGSLRSLTVPRAQVAGLRPDWTLADLKHAGVLNGALLAYPNIVITLDPPARMGRRTVRYLAHRLDDPAAFAAALGTQLVSRAVKRNARARPGR
ncbi:hypothetical protein OK349_05450 [Sphingomonas sp. BT-65]|uniref:hypothetical protein n=1 Tax=Sphingomonas sp. BT-65 TaxID=2989821 RepID=UPI0022357959|nr:hypothetical protein [Sphingomonas sp. BT-65]MCW4461145.1 hypothetical protein [Sphingomonas sp. BT-65]